MKRYRAEPYSSSICGPMSISTHMLNPMCSKLPCRNVAMINRHGRLQIHRPRQRSAEHCQNSAADCPQTHRAPKIRRQMALEIRGAHCATNSRHRTSRSKSKFRYVTGDWSAATGSSERLAAAMPKVSSRRIDGISWQSLRRACRRRGKASGAGFLSRFRQRYRSIVL